jgi:hypothetical protein
VPDAASGNGPEVDFSLDPSHAAAGSDSPAGTAASPTPPVAAETVSTTSTASVSEPVSGTPPAAAAHDPTSFADLNDNVVQDLNQSPFGDRLASQAMSPMQDVPRDATRSPQAVHDAAYRGIRTERPTGHDSQAGLQDQHWSKVKDATVNASGTVPATVEAINANRSPLQSRRTGESSLLLTTQGVSDAELPTGARGTRVFIAEPGEGPMGRPAYAEPGTAATPAEPGAVGGAQRDPNYSTEHKFADAHLIPEMREQIQTSRARAGLAPLDDVQLTEAAGEQGRYVMEGVPRTDLAQNPVQPWSGEVIQRPREPMPGGPQPGTDSPTLRRSLPDRALSRLLDAGQSETDQRYALARRAAEVSRNESPEEPGVARGLGELFLPMFFGPSGSAPTLAERDAAYNAQFSEDNPPIEGTERANPNYPEPPVTPAQIDAVRGHIAELRGAEAQAAHAEQQMETQEASHQGNQAPLQQNTEAMQAGIDATQSHQTTVGETQSSNEGQQQRQQEVQGLVEDYPSHESEISGLRLPLRAFMGMAHLGTYLPADAGEAMQGMHNDAGELLGALDQMDSAMQEQAANQPTEAESLQSDATAISDTSSQAETSLGEVQEAHDGSAQIETQNEECLAEAGENREVARNARSDINNSIGSEEARADSMQQSLQSWAIAHRDARREALGIATKRVNDAGGEVTAVREE